ncbi:MAG TPA: hypothetical protein VGP93_07250 [Polyangiaceae bacterium]|nr:hypothetical protein [Polyangiaceae bacterium]
MRITRPSVIGLIFGLSAAKPALANPELIQGTWVEITPAEVTTGAPETCIGQGIQIDPHSPSTLYWGNTPYQEPDGGLFKSTNGGETWNKVAATAPRWQGANDYVSMPVHVRVDPNDGQHLYAVDGVRGSATGFFISTDGGENFVRPPGFQSALSAASITTDDCYDVAVDPADFDHVLVSFHSAWNWESAMYGYDAGIMESTDGGESWTAHPPAGPWGAGHAVKFLYSPELGLGDSNTWLVGTQGDGFWRTTNAGDDWNHVSETDITHGGGTTYYASSGVLYAAGLSTMKSTDNGATWSNAGPGSTWAVYGDGDTLYTGGSFGANQSFQVSPETDGASWGDYNAQKFPDGPYEMAYDTTNGILYSSNWTSGVWALKVGEGTGVIPDPPTGGSSSGGAGAGGSTSTGGSGTSSGGSATTSGGSGGSGTGGAGTASGGAGTFTGGSTVANPSGDDRPPESDPGCACRAGRGQAPGSAWALLLGAFFVVRRWLFRDPKP